jgi:class 3 adenylate cyclase
MHPIDLTAVRPLDARPEIPFGWRAPSPRTAECFTGSAIQKTAFSRQPTPEVVRIQRAAVLFADIIAFTRMAEDWSPAATVHFLRRYQQRMAKQVFLHEGTVVQYSGDGIMATFGAPHPSADMASNALSCAFDMLDTIASWNAERSACGELPIRIGIGVHFGSVGIGQIGVKRHLEQAIAGDTVNVARKLEALTRKVGAALIASAELVDAIVREGRRVPRAERLDAHGPCRIPGRVNSIPIWVLARDSA